MKVQQNNNNNKNPNTRSPVRINCTRALEAANCGHAITVAGPETLDLQPKESSDGELNNIKDESGCDKQEKDDPEVEKWAKSSC